MTKSLSPEQVAAIDAALIRIRDGQTTAGTEVSTFGLPDPEGKYPGWLTLLIWVGLVTLSWVPIIAVVYLMWW